MKRDQAINQLSQIKLAAMTKAERQEQLEIMSIEDWALMREWKALPEGIRKEFELGILLDYPDSKRYDKVLLIWLRYSLQALSNEFLREELKVDKVEGEPQPMEACPCCGTNTIEVRGEYEICKVCWWEDDGIDNEDADKAESNANDGISLTKARYNFLIYGIHNPNRTDLLKLKDEKEAYATGREFEIQDDKYLIELGTNWKWEIKL